MGPTYTEQQARHGLLTGAKPFRDKKKIMSKIGDYIKTISDELGEYYTKTPKEFVKSSNLRKDEKTEKARNITSELRSLHNNLKEVYEFIVTRKSLSMSERTKNNKIVEDTAHELKKIEMYSEYWDIVAKRKASSIPRLLNRIGERMRFFKEFDNKTVYTILIYCRETADKISNLLDYK